MLYTDIARLQDTDLRSARAFVLAAQTRDGMAEYLARQRFWRDYLRAVSPIACKCRRTCMMNWSG